ncbi:VP5 [Gokushovirus MK-2017]|nr:VP5 [Gokushovirus MK-2017]
MIQNVYSVRDVKTGFGPLMILQNDAVALRSFEVSCRQSDSLMHWCAADYSLFCIGSFDDESGQLNPLDVPRHIADASAVKDGEE